MIVYNKTNDVIKGLLISPDLMLEPNATQKIMVYNPGQPDHGTIIDYTPEAGDVFLPMPPVNLYPKNLIDYTYEEFLESVKHVKRQLIKQASMQIIKEGGWYWWRQMNAARGALNYSKEYMNSVTADGTATSLSVNLDKVFVKASTVRVVLNGTQVASDDGNGNISGSYTDSAGATVNISGTVGYSTGAVTLNFTDSTGAAVAPEANLVFEVYYVPDAEKICFDFIDKVRSASDQLESNLNSQTTIAGVLDTIAEYEPQVRQQLKSIATDLIYIDF